MKKRLDVHKAQFPKVTLRRLLVVVAIVTLLGFVIELQARRVRFSREIASTLEGLETYNNGVQQQSRAIKTAILDSNVRTIRSPRVAHACIWTYPHKDIVIDWICSEPAFEFAEFKLSDGSIKKILVSELDLQSTRTLHRQCSVSLQKVLDGQSLGVQVESVAIVQSSQVRSGWKALDPTITR